MPPGRRRELLRRCGLWSAGCARTNLRLNSQRRLGRRLYGPPVAFVTVRSPPAPAPTSTPVKARWLTAVGLARRLVRGRPELFVALSGRLDGLADRLLLDHVGF